MSRRGGVTIVTALPGFASIKSLIERLAITKGAVITSSSSPLLARIRDFVEGDERYRYRYEAGEIEITALGELVRAFADVADVPLRPVANSAQQAALAGLAAASLDEGSGFHQCKTLPGFHEALASALQELRRHEISLGEATGLEGKLADIAKLDATFDVALDKLSLGTLSHRLRDLTESKPAKPSELRQVLWLGESEWPGLWLRFAEWMSESGADVVLHAERHVTGDPLFGLAEELGRAFPQSERIELEPPDALPASAWLFAPQAGPKSGARIVEAADEFLETEWAMRFAAGERGRVCLFAKSLDTYGPLLEAAALRFGMELAMDRQEPLLSNPFARHCLTALVACSKGSLPGVAELVGGAYGAVEPEQRKEAAAAVRACGRAENPWEALGTSANDTASPLPNWVSALVSWRGRSLASSFTLADWGFGLNKLIAATPWLDASTGASDVAQRDEQAQDAMVRALATSRLGIEPSRAYSLVEFVEHCEAAWRDARYWLRTKGKVRVATSPAAIGEVETVIAVGMLEGRLPGRRAEDPILLDSDRSALAGINGLWSLPSSYAVAEEGRRDFYRLACSAPNLVFFYPLAIGETAEIRAAPLDDMVSALGTEVESKPYELRFPEPNANLLDADILGAEAWHRAPLGERGQALLESVSNPRADGLADDVLRARIAELPRPLRLAHLRALNRCRFQYVAMAKLGLQGRKPKWAWDRLGRVVRRADLRPNDLERLRQNLMASLAVELDEMRGTVSAEELDLVAVAAPRVLDGFARREIESRALWNMRPVKQGASLHEAGMTQSIPVGGDTVTFDETFDVVYERDTGDLIPLRMAYVARDGDKDFEFEAGLMLLLQTTPRLERAAGVDSLQTGVRRILAKGKGEAPSNLRSKGEADLLVDKSGGTANDLRRMAKANLAMLLSVAAEGRVDAVPGEHCRRCDYAPLCRRSLNSETPGSWGDWEP